MKQAMSDLEAVQAALVKVAVELRLLAGDLARIQCALRTNKQEKQ